MTKYQKRHRIIATFFLLIFFPTLLPNNLFASNNGPKSPEAASFEPVDATDMVNLITGQYSYVLPLLNVPSPEGGYPIAMGYHAGIALDQEASWTGLGWNVNPGAIDRNINAYPDDYNASHLNEYFYDQGNEDYVSFISTGWSGYGVSVGNGFSWGSNQSLGGYVSIGYGVDLGTTSVGANARISSNGNVGIGIGASKGGLSVGLSVNSNDELGINVGFDNNGMGLSIGYNSSGSFTYSAKSGGLDFTLNQSGSHTTLSSGGIGINTSFNNTTKMGDYSMNSTNRSWGFFVPTPVGIFSLSFGKQTFKYWLAKNKENYVTGPLYFQKGVRDIPIATYIPAFYAVHNGMISCQYSPDNSGYCQYNDFILNGPHGYGKMHTFRYGCNGGISEGFPGPHSIPAYTKYESGNAFMDINEVNIENNALAAKSNVVNNNASFPNFDNYNIQAQGISGNMSIALDENAALIGLSDMENNTGISLNYKVLTNTTVPIKFDAKPNFYLSNEISTYINVNPATHNNSMANNNILYYSDPNSIDEIPKPRRKTSTFIEYFTNEEILNSTSYLVLKNKGYLQPTVNGLDRNSKPKDGVGAFKITTHDGKTYHYSLPVYNHEIITRTYGAVKQRPDQSQSYFEKRQLEPFATHWLLTAVTGPDYVDDGDGIADEGDLGYWTSFEYGKWTDAFIWKAGYKKDFLVDENNPTLKTWIKGRKQLYYLDKIKTRTHTALFIKSQRNDAKSENWEYSSVDHVTNTSGSYTSRFTVPFQNQLKLDKILLLKNQDAINIDKTYGNDLNENVNVGYPNSDKKGEIAYYNSFDNILDDKDNWENHISKAIKIIDFNYDYSLVPGDNRLTLKIVNFKGKGGLNILPPYKFDYINTTVNFNIDKKDGWGYTLNNPETYSLNKITTPQGGTINIEYESNNFISTVPTELNFSSENNIYYTADKNINLTGIPTTTIEVGSENYYPISLGQEVNIGFYKYVVAGSISNYTYKGTGHVSAILGTNKYQITFDGPIVNETQSCVGCTGGGGGGIWSALTVTIKLNNLPFLGGGPRVKNLMVSDDVDNYITDYKYGKNEDGIGYASYVPYSQNIAQELPYSSELPAPRVMYEYITMSSHKKEGESTGKIRYKFNIMKSKDPNKPKYGDFYEIVETKQPNFLNSFDKDVNISSFIVKDNLASLGQLLEVSTFNNKNQQLSKISNTYYGMSDNLNNIGVTQESYQTYKTVDYITNSAAVKDKWVVNSSTRIKYPSIIKSSTQQSNGYSYTTEFLDYDLISGTAKETKSFSSDGQSYKTRTIPAYIKYPEMGSKVDDINNKNMLSQTAVNYSYIFDKNDPVKPWKETGVGITTWNNIWTYIDMAGTPNPVVATAPANQKIWRKHKTYVWNGIKDSNGIFTNYDNITDSGDDKFVWAIGVGSQPAQWKQTSEVTLYDHFSAPLEMKDINNNYASTKMGDKDSKTTATGNGRYGEIFYSGAENVPIAAFPTFLEPEVAMINATINPAYYHTGKQSIAANSSSKFGVTLKDTRHRSGKYKVSVWVEKSNAAKARINNNGLIENFTESYNAGNWVLKVGYINNVPTGNYGIHVTSLDTTTVYFDDLMIRPVASSITGYVYNEWDELSYIIGNNGLATRFEYDAAGRLVKTSTEVIDDTPNGITGGFKAVKTNVYNNRYSN